MLYSFVSPNLSRLRSSSQFSNSIISMDSSFIFSLTSLRRASQRGPPCSKSNRRRIRLKALGYCQILFFFSLKARLVSLSFSFLQFFTYIMPPYCRQKRIWRFFDVIITLISSCKVVFIEKKVIKIYAENKCRAIR